MIYKYPKIVQGTAFDAKIPCVIQNTDGTREPIDVATLQDVSVRVIGRNCKDMQVEWSGASNYFIAHIPATFPIDTYKVEVEGVLGGRSVSSVFERGFAIVAANEYADYEDYIAGGEISMPETIWVLAQDTDVIEQVIEEYRQAKAQADAVRAEYERKVQELEGLATETQATANKQEILTAIGHIDIPTDDLATKANQQKMMAAFNMADEMPDMQALTDTEIINSYSGYDSEGEHIEGIADQTYGHLVPAQVTIDDEPFTFYQERTYSDYGYSVLYKNGVAIDTTTTHPQEDDELTTTI